jgi:hypothetical protein
MTNRELYNDLRKRHTAGEMILFGAELLALTGIVFGVGAGLLALAEILR